MPTKPGADDLLKNLRGALAAATEAVRGTSDKVGAALPSRDTVRDVVTGAGVVVKAAASSSAGVVRGATERVSAALPSKQSVKVALGKALVQGGRVLMDPQAAAGELAVKVGEGLLADASELRWFVVRIGDDGQATTHPFVQRKDAEQFFRSTRAEFPRQFLCEAVALPGQSG